MDYYKFFSKYVENKWKMSDKMSEKTDDDKTSYYQRNREKILKRAKKY